MTMSIAPALTVEDLTIDIDGALVVDGVSFSVGAGEVIALVGESGCGKSLTALALLGLLPDAAQIVCGRILLDDVDLVPLPEREMRRVRGSRLSIIFQEATASLDPLTAVGSQIAEAYALHHRVSRSQARARAKDMLVAVGIPGKQALEQLQGAHRKGVRARSFSQAASPRRGSKGRRCRHSWRLSPAKPAC